MAIARSPKSDRKRSQPMTAMRRISILLALLGLACSPGEDASTAADGTSEPTDGTPTSSNPTTASTPGNDDDDATADGTATPTSDDDDGTDGGGTWPAPQAGADVSISAFAAQHAYYVSADDNQREADVEVEFPAADEGYAAIALEVAVSCPEGGCDFWDRYASIAVVDNPGADDERVIEIARFVTPYRVAGSWSIDVSHLRPLLTGTRTLRLVVDTWVGPGNSEGAGWLVDARFDMTGGVASPRPVAVVPIYTRRVFEVGDPEQPVLDVVPPVSVEIPQGVTGVTLVSLITGHGHGNAENCAEFCQENHGFLLGGQDAIQRTLWREDCNDTPVAGQIGNWSQNRAGWCPGADVLPWIEDIGGSASAGGLLSIEYAVSPYENTCRPNAPSCEGCPLFTSCEYDDASHTPPQVRMSTLLVGWVD